MIRVLFALMLLATTAAAQVPSTFFGMHILHAVNGSTAWPTDKFGALRLWDSGVDWHEIATSRGVYNWTNFDKWMSLAQQHGVDVTYTFGRVPSWANGGQGTTVPMSNMQDWDDFVRAVATRAAGRVKYWEIWNEPNDTHFWSGNVATLVTMAQHARDIIKSVDANAVILTPSPTWTTTSPDQWMTQYLQAGGGQYADVIAFHGYVNSSPESIDPLAANMWKVMNANGQGSKPLWDTEASFSLSGSCTTSICDQDQQAAFLVRHYMLHLSRKVERYFWYAWEDTWGTLWNGSVLKPGVAYQQAYNWMVGATMSQACSADSAGTWTCGITRPGGYQGLVVWNPSKTVSYTAASQYKQKRDIYGVTAAVASNGVMNVDYRPVLLETGTATTPDPTPTPTPVPTADFSLLPDSTVTLQVKAGSSGSMKLNVSPQGSAFSQAIQLSCTGPAGSTCTLSPSSLTPGTSTVSTMLTITADKSLLAARLHNGMSLAMWMPLFGVTLVGVRGRKLLLGGLVVAALAICVACGGAAATTSGAKAPEVKIAAYTVTVTATSGSLQHSVTVPFAVN
jgi:polysaccharide biosynthesis protein PslG